MLSVEGTKLSWVTFVFHHCLAINISGFMHFLQFSTVFFLLTVPSNLSFISIYGSSEPATSFFLKSVKNVAKGFIRITYCNSKTKRNGSHLKCCCTPPPLFSVNWHSLFWISHFILFWRRLIPSVPLKTMWLPKTSLPPPLPPDK